MEEFVSRDRAAWDGFVATAPGATFCHLSGWWGVMEEVLGHSMRLWVARDADGSITGVLPLVVMRSRLFGRSGVSMPFLNYGGAAGSTVDRRVLTEAAITAAGDERLRRLVLRERTALAPVSGKTEKVTVLLDLPDAPEPLWAGLRAKVRSQVRRPMKEGMQLRFGHEELPAFYEVFARNMRDLGTPVLPRPFFEAIRDAFSERCVFGTVRHGGAAVAAGCGFCFRDEFEMTWASSLREHSRSAPNMLLYWGFMERMIERGVRSFNFGRCTPGGGTHRFKKQWGGHDLPLPWRRWPEGEAASGPLKDSPRYALASALWKRLPLPVANLVGPRIARGLPTF